MPDADWQSVWDQEHGLPDDGALVAWSGRWRYFKSIKVFSTDTGGLLHWAVGEFTVKTHSKLATGTPRVKKGLDKYRGSRPEPPETFEELAAWADEAFGDYASADNLHAERPPAPTEEE